MVVSRSLAAVDVKVQVQLAQTIVTSSSRAVKQSTGRRDPPHLKQWIASWPLPKLHVFSEWILMGPDISWVSTRMEPEPKLHAVFMYTP